MWSIKSMGLQNVHIIKTNRKDWQLLLAENQCKTVANCSDFVHGPVHLLYHSLGKISKTAQTSFI